MNIFDLSNNLIFFNYTNEMQEFLQRKAPNLGCQCENLWGFEESGNGPFKVRVIIFNSLKDEELKMEWSAYTTGKKEARQDASRLALKWLFENDDNLCFRDGFITIYDKKRLTGSGVSNNNSSGTSHSLPSECIFPNNVDYMTPNIYTKKTDAENDDLEESYSNSEFKKLFHISPLESVETTVESIPSNLGHLGEEYIFNWLKTKVKDENLLKWKNGTLEQGQSYDIEYDIDNAEDGDVQLSRFIEVKTAWKKSRIRLSKEQMNLFINNDQMLIVITHFKNVFEDPPSAPNIRIIRYPKFRSFDIDNNKIGILVGKNGKNIRRLEADSNCSIKLIDKSVTISSNCNSNTQLLKGYNIVQSWINYYDIKLQKKRKIDINKLTNLIKDGISKDCQIEVFIVKKDSRNVVVRVRNGSEAIYESIKSLWDVLEDQANYYSPNNKRMRLT